MACEDAPLRLYGSYLTCFTSLLLSGVRLLLTTLLRPAQNLSLDHAESGTFPYLSSVSCGHRFLHSFITK